MQQFFKTDDYEVKDAATTTGTATAEKKTTLWKTNRGGPSTSLVMVVLEKK